MTMMKVNFQCTIDELVPKRVLVLASLPFKSVKKLQIPHGLHGVDRRLDFGDLGRC